MNFFDELLSEQTEMSMAQGLVSGIVLENNDKEHPNMVKVEYFVGQQGKNKSSWIPVSSWYAGNGYGSYFLPDIGTEVLIAFYMGNWDKPIVIGAMWNKQNQLIANSFQEKNTVKMIQTKGGHKIIFQDEEKKESISIQTPKGLNLFFDDEKQQIVLSDKDSKNTVTIDSQNGALSLDAEKQIDLKIGGNSIVTLQKGKAEINTDTITCNAKQSVNISAKTTINMKATSISCKADTSFKLQTDGIMEAKGNMVKIN